MIEQEFMNLLHYARPMAAIGLLMIIVSVVTRVIVLRHHIGHGHLDDKVREHIRELEHDNHELLMEVNRLEKKCRSQDVAIKLVRNAVSANTWVEELEIVK